MKTGTKFIFAGILLGIGYSIIVNRDINISNKIDTESDPSKFENRLKEFFFEEELDKAIKEYVSLIDAGFNPKDAYEIVRTKI